MTPDIKALLAFGANYRMIARKSGEATEQSYHHTSEEAEAECRKWLDRGYYVELIIPG